MTNKKKSSTLYFVLATLVITVILKYLILDTIIRSYFNSSIVDFIVIYVTVFILALSILLLIFSNDNTFNRQKLKWSIISCYLTILLISFFSKEIQASNPVLMNFDLLESLTYAVNTNMGKVLLISNILVIIPSGYIFGKIRWSIIWAILIFALIEFIQYYFSVGIFDILDICLNTFGFIIGAILSKITLYLRKNFI